MTRAPLPDDLRQRVTAARHLLRRARQTLGAGGAFAAGYALLQLRDAAALLLAAAADHLGAEVAGASLGRLVEAVEAAAPAPLTHRSALDRLAAAADAFLTSGRDPEGGDSEGGEVRGLLHDVESLFAETVTRVLETDPSRLTLRRLVGHRRSENWLAKAEEALRQEDFTAAVRASAAAFTLFRRHLEAGADEAIDESAPSTEDLSPLRRELRRQAARLDLVMAGLDLAGYRRFRRTAPEVDISADNAVHFAEGGADEPGADEASFCYDFVLTSLLTLRDNHLPPDTAPAQRANVVLRVLRETPILVAPDPEAEEIRRVTSGEVLKTHRGGEPSQGHLAIVVDGDTAWVVADAVEEIG